MFIENLNLENFRNITKLNTVFSKNFNIIYGDNAQGKTNLIESIFLCASGRSHRTAKDTELIKFNQDNYYVEISINKDVGMNTVSINYLKNIGKNIKINEKKIAKIGNLMGNLIAVIFSPEDLLIIKEGPSERRRFIDITISQIKPKYFYDLQQYSKVLHQRNSLLKELQNNKSLMNTLEVWNQNLSSVGSRIMKMRYDFIMRLNKLVLENHYKLSNNTETLKIKYKPSFGIDNYENLDFIENSFLKAIDLVKSSEIYRGSTYYGPHKDEYEIFLDDKSLKSYGSQGQKRTSILSIKLSEIDIIKEETGEFPVLLLDDVMSELDFKRQIYLFENLKDIQVFITSTEKLFDNENPNRNINYFNMSNGEIICRGEPTCSPLS